MTDSIDIRVGSWSVPCARCMELERQAGLQCVVLLRDGVKHRVAGVHEEPLCERYVGVAGVRRDS